MAPCTSSSSFSTLKPGSQNFPNLGWAQSTGPLASEEGKKGQMNDSSSAVGPLGQPCLCRQFWSPGPLGTQPACSAQTCTSSRPPTLPPWGISHSVKDFALSPEEFHPILFRSLFLPVEIFQNLQLTRHLYPPSPPKFLSPAKHFRPFPSPVRKALTGPGQPSVPGPPPPPHGCWCLLAHLQSQGLTKWSARP